jgi:hypothetical protein
MLERRVWSVGGARMSGTTSSEDALPGPADRFFGDEVRRGQAWSSPWEREHDWYLFVTGFRFAAEALLTQLEGTPRLATKLGPPIVYLYRHHLELAIKSLTRQCRSLLSKPDGATGDHPLDDLWRACLSELHELYGEAIDTEEVRETTRLLKEYCYVDQRSTAFRYPEARDGTPSVCGDIDLTEIASVFGKVSDLLDCISTDLEVNHSGAF